MINLISFFFIFLPLFSHENVPIGLVNHIGAFSYIFPYVAKSVQVNNLHAFQLSSIENNRENKGDYKQNQADQQTYGRRFCLLALFIPIISK